MNSRVAGIWYREPWFWMVAGPLLVAIVVSFIGAYVAIKGADDRVIDDYYTEGKAINHRFAADKLATKLGVTAQVQFDTTTGEVLIDVAGLAAAPENLTLHMSHPLKADQDQSLPLIKINASRYRADISHLALGHWYLQLEPSAAADADKWRLIGDIDLRTGQALTLAPEVQ